MAEHSYAGLYYPFIHFKDDRWLKLTALYWDSMARIAPSEYTTDDSETVKALGDYVVPVPPKVSQKFGDTFVEFVNERGAALRERYGLANIDRWDEVPVDQRPPAAGGASGTDPRLSYVFHEKMPPEFRRALVDMRIARPDPEDPQWFGMHPALYRVYMTALADQLAGERGLSPLTDETIDHVAVGGHTVERLAQALLDDVDLVQAEAAQREIESAAAYMAIGTVMPQNIDAVSVEDILAFRDRFSRERAAFQKQMVEFVKPRDWLTKIEDRELLEERIRAEFEKEMKPKLEDLRQAMRDSHMDTVAGVLSLQVVIPAAIAKVAAFLGLAANPVGLAAAGTALAVIPILRDRRKEDRELKSSPVSYLLRVEGGLAPNEVSGWIRETARKFRFV